MPVQQKAQTEKFMSFLYLITELAAGIQSPTASSCEYRLNEDESSSWPMVTRLGDIGEPKLADQRPKSLVTAAHHP